MSIAAQPAVDRGEFQGRADSPHAHRAAGRGRVGSVRLARDLSRPRAGLLGGHGQRVSMLPSQNAAGNWIKVVQRVPVVIALDARDLAAHPLRVGLSMRATVDTHDRNGHALDSEPPTPAVSTRVHDGVASDAERRGRDHPRQSGRVTPARELGAAGCHDRPAARRALRRSLAPSSASSTITIQRVTPRTKPSRRFAPTFAFSPSMSAPFKRVSCLRHRRPCLRDYSRTARCACAACAGAAAPSNETWRQYDEQQSRCRLSWAVLGRSPENRLSGRWSTRAAARSATA